MTREEIDSIQEPTLQEFQERCKNIEQEKRDKIRENFRRLAEERFGGPITNEVFEQYFNEQRQKMVKELNDRCLR